MEELETVKWILAHFLGLLRVLCDLQSRLSFRVNLHESLACKWTFYTVLANMTCCNSAHYMGVP